MFLRYVSAANINLFSADFIFKPVFRSKGVAKLIKKNKPISYTAVKENIVNMLKTVAPNLNIGIHSLRSGGASVAANSDVNDVFRGMVGGKVFQAKTCISKILW